jgi:hypothetical protein
LQHAHRAQHVMMGGQQTAAAAPALGLAAPAVPDEWHAAPAVPGERHALPDGKGAEAPQAALPQRLLFRLADYEAVRLSIHRSRPRLELLDRTSLVPEPTLASYR